MAERAGAVIGALIALVFGLFMVGNVLPDAIDGTLVENVNENYSVTTGSGTVSAVVTLSDPHYYEDTSHMEVTSSESGTDSAAISAYNSGTQEVTVIGLAVSTTRILNIDYYRERDNDQFTYFNSFMGIISLIIAIGLVWMLIKSFFSTK